MNIFSYNVRGLGNNVKWKFIKEPVVKEVDQVLCLQETKKEVISKELCYAIWGNHEVH